MRWWKKARDGDGEVFLEGTESTLSDFGHTAGEGFAEAWKASLDRDVRDQDAADDLDASLRPHDDKRSRRSRDLDRSSRRGVVVVSSLVVLGLAAAVAFQQGVFDSADGEPANAQLPDGELASIGAVRPYTNTEGVATASASVRVDRAFVASATADPTPIPGEASMPPVFGRFLWAGRAHIALLAPSLDEESECVVMSLVADDLRVVDLASYGRCSAEYQATGDRVACVGDGTVVLEVWPFDPDAVVEQPDVVEVRVRVESAIDTSGSVSSLRGAESVADGLLNDITTMTGRPGDLIELRVGGRSGTCTLLDRAEVPVQLL